MRELAAPPLRIVPLWQRGSWRLVERNALAYRRMWYVFLSGIVEPLLFLASIGVGVGHLVGDLHVGGQTLSYPEFVAPGLLATAAMNGALLDTTFNFFVKFKYAHTYDAVLATPLATDDVTHGEVWWAVLRGGCYSAVFVVTMLAFGDVRSWWTVFAVPVAMLIAFAFAGAGLAGSSFMRSFIDFDYVSLAMIPMFLFSATFFPISQYPDALQTVIRCSPLYQGVVLERSLVLGDVHWSLCLNALYLAVMGAAGVSIARARIGRLLQP